MATTRIYSASCIRKSLYSDNFSTKKNYVMIRQLWWYLLAAFGSTFCLVTMKEFVEKKEFLWLIISIALALTPVFCFWIALKTRDSTSTFPEAAILSVIALVLFSIFAFHGQKNLAISLATILLGISAVLFYIGRA